MWTLAAKRPLPRGPGRYKYDKLVRSGDQSTIGNDREWISTEAAATAAATEEEATHYLATIASAQWSVDE